MKYATQAMSPGGIAELDSSTILSNSTLNSDLAHLAQKSTGYSAQMIHYIVLLHDLIKCGDVSTYKMAAKLNNC